MWWWLVLWHQFSAEYISMCVWMSCLFWAPLTKEKISQWLLIRQNERSARPRNKIWEGICFPWLIYSLILWLYQSPVMSDHFGNHKRPLHKSVGRKMGSTVPLKWFDYLISEQLICTRMKEWKKSVRRSIWDLCWTNEHRKQNKTSRHLFIRFFSSIGQRRSLKDY